MCRKILKNGKVYSTEGFFFDGDVVIGDDLFTDVIRTGEHESTYPDQDAARTDDTEIIDVAGLYLIPGLTDIHFHGCMGHDFCEGDTDAIQLMADYEESVGVTTICPATMTLPKEELVKIARAARDFKSDHGAALTGINMEGPFISPEKKGAQNPAYIIPPDIRFFEAVQDASGGLIKIVDLAPETKGAFDFIAAVRDRAVLSLAHTTADHDLAARAFEAGITHMTHLYNAMNPMGSRDPGPIPAAADTPYVEAEIICDGIHIHPAMVRTAFRLFGPERIIFISDSMEAVGMEDGDYSLGGQAVHKEGNLATLQDGTIAGSATNLMDCMRTAVHSMGIPLETAVRCAAVNPARSIGIYDRYGSIEPGKVANLVALDHELNIRMILNRGKTP